MSQDASCKRSAASFACMLTTIFLENIFQGILYLGEWCASRSLLYNILL